MDDDPADLTDVSPADPHDVDPATHASSAWRVLGELDTIDGVGVLGHSTATSGTGAGVEGVTDSSAEGAAGVRGSAPNGARGVVGDSTYYQGVLGLSEETAGVRGETTNGGWFGVLGINQATTNSDGGGAGVYGLTRSTDYPASGVYGLADWPSGTTYGVRGETQSTDDGAVGVLGEDTAGSGETYGVKGVTASHNANGAGVFGYAPETDKESAAVRAESPSGGLAVDAIGHVDVSHVGLDANLTSDQPISPGSRETIVFDDVPRDDFDGYDDTTGVYTVQAAGDYHVDANARWRDLLEGETGLFFEFRVNGITQARRRWSLPGPSAETELVDHHLSRTLFDLQQNDTIEVLIRQDSSSTVDLAGARQDTYLTIQKCG